MRWRGIAQALGVAAAIIALGSGSAAGQSRPDRDDSWDTDDAPATDATSSPFAALTAAVSPPSFDLLTGGLPDRIMYFAGFDLWRCGLAGYTGMQWAPGRLDRDGFILRLIMSDGLERLNADGRRYQTHIFRSAIMPGYKFKRGNLEVQLLAGVDFELDVLAIDGRQTWKRNVFGARVTTDLWWEPTEAIMAQASFSASTIDSATSMRVAAGWRVMDRFWIGPEVLASSDHFSRQHRVGAHLTGLRTGAFEWSIAAGYVGDSFSRSGAYARLGMLMRPDRRPFFE